MPVLVVVAGAPRTAWITHKWENTSIQRHTDYRLPKPKFSSTTKILFVEPTGEIIRIYVNYFARVAKSVQPFKSSLKENAVSLSLIKYKMRLKWRRNKLSEQRSNERARVSCLLVHSRILCVHRAASSWALDSCVLKLLEKKKLNGKKEERNA